MLLFAVAVQKANIWIIKECDKCKEKVNDLAQEDLSKAESIKSTYF